MVGSIPTVLKESNSITLRMMIMKSKEEFIEELKKYAQRETLNDLADAGENVCIDDFAGGNLDDAYWTGYKDAETELARKVLKFFIK